jgi:hypothetical protein
MVEKLVNPGHNIIAFANYHRIPKCDDAAAAETRRCRHCGAALLEDESEDECSSADIAVRLPARAPRRFRAD